MISCEDLAGVAIRVEQFELELSPKSMLTVRLERCSHNDYAMTSERVRNARPEFDEARRASVDFLFDHIVQTRVTRYREPLANT